MLFIDKQTNFEVVVPKVLQNNDTDTLVLQTGSIEISNIEVNKAVMDTKKPIEEYKKEWFEKVEKDSENLFRIAVDQTWYNHLILGGATLAVLRMS